MIKKILSVIVTFLIMLVLAVLSTTMIIRSYLSFDTISKVMEQATPKGGPTLDSALNDMFKQSGLNGEISDYVDTKELEKVIKEYATDLFAYELGDGKMPSINNEDVNKLLDKAIEQFEKKTGEKVDRTEVNKSLDEIDKNIEKSDKLSTQLDSNTLGVVKTVYAIIASKTLVIALLIVLLVLIGIVFLLNMNVAGTLSYLISAFLINGVCIMIIPLILNAIFSGQEIVKIVTAPFYKYGLISIGISLFFVIIYIVVKVTQKKSDHQEEIINTPNEQYNEYPIDNTTDYSETEQNDDNEKTVQ